MKDRKLPCVKKMLDENFGYIIKLHERKKNWTGNCFRCNTGSKLTFDNESYLTVRSCPSSILERPCLRFLGQEKIIFE